MENKFLDCSDKIKLIRRELGLKQYDFETENFTRGYLGLIESRRRKLTRFASDIIVKRVRTRIQELNLNIQIDDDYFMRTPEEDAELHCNELLKNKDINDEQLAEVISIAERFKFYDLIAKAYKMWGDLFYNKNDYAAAEKKYLRAMINIDMKTEPIIVGNIYNALGAVHYRKLEYETSIMYYEAAIEEYIKAEDKKLALNTIQNIAVAYKKSGDIENAIKQIDFFIENIEVDGSCIEQFVYAVSVKANCYNLQGDYDKAINVYGDLIELVKDNGGSEKLLGYLYNNISVQYLGKCEYLLADKYCEDSINVREKMDPELINRTILQKAKILLKKDQIDEAIESTHRAINMALKHNDYEYIIKGYDLLEKCYEKNKEEINYSKLQEITQECVSAITINGTENIILQKLLKLQYLALNHEDIKEAKLLNRQLLQYIK